jgi:hypothetical protein
VVSSKIYRKQTLIAMTAENSRTGSTVAIIRKNGELFAVPHKLKKTPCSPGEKFSSSTTHKEHYAKPMSLGSPKPLTPYHHNHQRNRLPVRFDNEPEKYVRFCAERNISRDIKIKDGSNADRTRFMTTSKSTYIEHSGVPVGFSNTGIVAEKTQWVHKRQAD